MTAIPGAMPSTVPSRKSRRLSLLAPATTLHDRERGDRHHPDHGDRNDALADDAALNPRRAAPEQPLQRALAQHAADRKQRERAEQHADAGAEEPHPTAPAPLPWRRSTPAPETPPARRRRRRHRQQRRELRTARVAK